MQVFIDGQPADQAPVFYTNFIRMPGPCRRATRPGVAAPHAVDLGTNVVPQTWTITMTSDAATIASRGASPAPTARATWPARSGASPGQIGIDPRHWRSGEDRRKGHKVLYGESQRRALSPSTSIAAPGAAEFPGRGAGRFPAAGREPAQSATTLEIVTAGDGDVTIDGLYVFNRRKKDEAEVIATRSRFR